MATALVLIEGFDKYEPAGAASGFATAMLNGEWTVSVAPSFVAPLSTYGAAASLASGNTLTSSTFASLTRIVGTLRMMVTSGTTVASITLRNGATAAFTIEISQTNGVRLRTGGTAGTVVATGGSLLMNVAVCISFDITIGASSSYSVLLDGSVVLSGTGDTGNGQSSVNTAVLSCTTASSGQFDDLALYDPAQAAYNSSVLTDNIVVETQWSNGDNQTQFTNDGNIVIPAGLSPRGIWTFAGTPITGANQLILVKIIPETNCTINSVAIRVFSPSGSAKCKAVIYSDSAGSPNSLLDTGPEVVGVSGTTVFALTTPQSLTSGTSYWIGFITDTNFSMTNFETTLNLGIKKANTYASGAPNPAGGGFTTGLATWSIYALCTGATVSWVSVSLNPVSNASTSQVHDATVGHEDIQTFPALQTTPSAVYGGALKAFASKSDSGTRTANLNMISGATDSTGSNPGFSPTTTRTWFTSIYDLDPDTGLPWTESAINNAKSGYSVAS